MFRAVNMENGYDMTGVGHSPSGQNRRLRVMVAEASAILAEKLQTELGSLPFVEIVGAAETSREALALFLHSRAEVVIVSIYLPDKSGFDLLRYIKGAAADCKVILLCAWPDVFIQETAKALGAAGVCPSTDGFDELRGLLDDFSKGGPGR